MVQAENPIGTLLRLPHVTCERLGQLKSMGLDCIQVAGVTDEYLDWETGRARSDVAMGKLEEAGLSVPSMFLSFAGQTWTREGVGIVPARYRTERMVQSCRQMNWGRRYGISSIVCHVGYIPDVSSQAGERFLGELRRLVSFAQENEQEFLFETASENAEEMLSVFQVLDMPNAGMNFDPANALYYNQDEPSYFMERLFPYIRSVHCKDALRPLPGEEYGHETLLGQGGTGFAALLSGLLSMGFAGPLIIERELPPGPEQERDIRQAIEFIREVLAQT